MLPSITDIGVLNLCLLGASLFTAWYIISAVTAWHRLRSVPGPFLAKFSYLWLARTAVGGRQYQINRDLGKKYGPLVRVGPNELSTDDPEVIRMINAVRSPYGKDPWYLAARWNPYQDNLFTLIDNNAHDKFKSRTASAYSGRETEIPALEPAVDAQVLTLLNVIRNKYLFSPGNPAAKHLELSTLSCYFTMDVITKVAFGEEFGYLKSESDVYDFLEGVKNNWPFLSITVDVPWIRNFFYSPLFLKYFGPKETDEKGMGRLMRVAKQAVAKRFTEESKGERDMMGSFIRHGLTRTECEAEGLFMIIAGSDTTASAIRVTMLYVMTQPQVYRKIKDVIMQAIRDGNISHPIRYEEAGKIPYLQAIIYEGLRMRTPAPGLYLKTVPAEGEVIHGKFIPGGTAIGMNNASLQRSTKLFGSDADVFWPERFLEVDAETRLEMERNVELAFGYGRWMCAGKPVAFMELNKVFFELLREFDFQLVDPTKPWDSSSYSVFIEENMWVKVTPSISA
ncbi:cytochrome P450 [Pseudomassariella vexata]|uniref:Cytochrome P450 n=1 Tax=Pseudomassariella vexata TaxID=1141098 RepID=A0A1Y2DG56_9PEZI|nr:cytochrome P450 [Pseudomassariella vexata]ORY58096.1 cytochrome P450 [Pseudomassariella vexata]